MPYDFTLGFSSGLVWLSSALGLAACVSAYMVTWDGATQSIIHEKAQVEFPGQTDSRFDTTQGNHVIQYHVTRMNHLCLRQDLTRFTLSLTSASTRISLLVK